jgi:arylsulfatase A-like enzyme
MKNVVLFTVDVLRKDVIGLYGGDLGLTPFLDSLKEKSLLFTRHQAAGPYTQASFPGILASSYFLEYGNPTQLSPKRTLVSEVVKRGGFSTAAFHSNAYLSAFVGWNRGWDHFYDSMQDHVTDMVPYIKGDVINKKVDRWLQSYTRQSAGKPFFLWVHYMDLHEPYVPDEKYTEQIDPHLKLRKEEMFALFKEVLLPRDASDPEKVETLRKLYQAHVLEVDEYAKDFFGVLHQHGILGNCIMIITADHGDEFGEHGGLSHDGKMYSELIDVPMIIYDSDMTEGQTVATVSSGVDVPPTVASLFGLEPADTWHGQPLLPLENYISKGAFGEAIGKLSHKVKETDRPAHFYQTDNLKIIHHTKEDKWELYDLDEDPNEQNNMVELSETAEQLKKQLNSRITWHLEK